MSNSPSPNGLSVEEQMAAKYPYCCQEVANPDVKWRSCDPCENQFYNCLGRDKNDCDSNYCDFVTNGGDEGVCRNKDMQFAQSTNCDGITSGSCGSNKVFPTCTERTNAPMDSPIHKILKDTKLNYCNAMNPNNLAQMSRLLSENGIDTPISSLMSKYPLEGLPNDEFCKLENDMCVVERRVPYFGQQAQASQAVASPSQAPQAPQPVDETPTTAASANGSSMSPTVVAPSLTVVAPSPTVVAPSPTIIAPPLQQPINDSLIEIQETGYGFMIAMAVLLVIFFMASK